MSEENKLDLEKLVGDIDEKLAKKLDQKFSDFDNKLAKLSTKEEPEESFEEDDDGIVTKSDLKKVLEMQKNNFLKESEKVANSIFESKTRKVSKDVEVIKDFPKLNPESGQYDNKFYEDVTREIERKVKGGYNAESPDLIYDAASVVEKQWIKNGKYVPQSTAEMMNQKNNNQQDSFEVTGRAKPSGTPNAFQTELANKLGLTKEKLAQHMKNTR